MDDKGRGNVHVVVRGKGREAVLHQSVRKAGASKPVERHVACADRAKKKGLRAVRAEKTARICGRERERDGKHRQDRGLLF